MPAKLVTNNSQNYAGTLGSGIIARKKNRWKQKQNRLIPNYFLLQLHIVWQLQKYDYRIVGKFGESSVIRQTKIIHISIYN